MTTRGSQNQRTRQIALRIADLRRHHADVVPAIVGPEGAHHGGKESGNTPHGGHVLGKVGEVACPGKEADGNHCADEGHFQDRDEDLYIAARLYAHIVNPGQDHDYANGDKLAVVNLKQAAAGANMKGDDNHRRGEDRHEGRQVGIETGGEGRDGTALCHPELSPTIEKNPRTDRRPR